MKRISIPKSKGIFKIISHQMSEFDNNPPPEWTHKVLCLHKVMFPYH